MDLIPIAIGFSRRDNNFAILPNYNYQWTASSGFGRHAFSNPTGTVTEFFAERRGSYFVRLTVSDGVQSATETVRVEIQSNNQPPIPSVQNSPSTGILGLPVPLNASASSDPNGDPLTYEWIMLLRPESSQAEIVDPSAEVTEFLPDVAGAYRIGLRVSDRLVTRGPVHYLVVVDDPTVNDPPKARVNGSQRWGVEGLPIPVTGEFSLDIEGSPLAYSWTVVSQPEGSTAEFADETAVATTFTGDTIGAYEVSLVVNDGELDSPAEIFIIHVSFNEPPQVSVAQSQNRGRVGIPILALANVVDSYYSDLTYQWSAIDQPVGSQISFEKRICPGNSLYCRYRGYLSHSGACQ